METQLSQESTNSEEDASECVFGITCTCTDVQHLMKNVPLEKAIKATFLFMHLHHP